MNGLFLCTKFLCPPRDNPFFFFFCLVLSTWGVIDLRYVILYANGEKKKLSLILMQIGSE